MTLRSAITAFCIAVLWSGQVISADLPGMAPDAPTPPPQKQRGIWAAISYSKADGKYGFFWGADKRKEATDSALKHCRHAGGRDCSIVAVFRNHRHWNDDDHTGFPYNHCGALAVGKTVPGRARPWGAETAKTRRKAESLSLQACERSGNRCKVLEWVCT